MCVYESDDITGGGACKSYLHIRSHDLQNSKMVTPSKLEFKLERGYPSNRTACVTLVSINLMLLSRKSDNLQSNHSGDFCIGNRRVGRISAIVLIHRIFEFLLFWIHERKFPKKAKRKWCVCACVTLAPFLTTRCVCVCVLQSSWVLERFCSWQW